MSSSTCFIEPGEDEHLLEAAIARLTSLGLPDALWERRLDIWSRDRATQRQIADRLGWLTALAFVRPHLERIGMLAENVRREGFTDIVLFGMGGSSLTSKVLAHVLGAAPGFPRFRVLDSVNPSAVREVMAHAASSLFILASKTGTTLEPNVLAAEARNRLKASGHPQWASRFVAITDEGSELHVRARAEGFREVFINPSDIGGRYSALSFFGLVPAGLMGIPLEPLTERASAMASACRAPDPRKNPGLMLGAMMFAAASAGRDKLTLLLPERLAALGLWVEQLVAESTGKQQQGIVPVTSEPSLPRYGTDRCAVVVQLGDEIPVPDVIARFRQSGAPIATIRMVDHIDIGTEFFRWEFATATAGLLMGVNPFDEPNVQQAKNATRALLEAYRVDGRLTKPDPRAAGTAAELTLSRMAEHLLAGAPPHRFLQIGHDGDYLALLAYVSPFDKALRRVLVNFRAEVGRRTGLATTFGYGPRYLHSTGQLHKGGQANGLFVIVSATPEVDLPVPGEPYSFGVVESAQALGDFASLGEIGRRALHVQLPAPTSQSLSAVFQMLLDGLS